MTWKKSNDGGIDFEVEELIQQHKREQQPEKFNPFATAHTMTFNFNFEEKLPPPKSRKQQIRDNINALRTARKPKYI